MSRPISSSRLSPPIQTHSHAVNFRFQILFSRQALMIRNLLLHYTKSQKLGRCVGFYSNVISRLFFFFSNSRGRFCAIYIKKVPSIFCWLLLWCFFNVQQQPNKKNFLKNISNIYCNFVFVFYFSPKWTSFTPFKRFIFSDTMTWEKRRKRVIKFWRAVWCHIFKMKTQLIERLQPGWNYLILSTTTKKMMMINA